MLGGEDWEAATLLTTLPKEIAVALQPTAEGSWLASVIGMAGVEGAGDSEEAAEREALAVLHQLLAARCRLARAALGSQILQLPSTQSGRERLGR
jgi:predicted RNase H-like HicB family nuclease